MKQIYTHGLGQTASSWNNIIAEKDSSEDSICLNLSELMQDKEVRYKNLYRVFADECDRYDGRIALCGLSLGGVLSLNYAIDRPQKIHSLILIATQYKMPRRSLQFQNMLFRFMPNSMFKQMGFEKSDIIRLCKTMANLDLSEGLSKVSCPTLVICGEKDNANKKASVELANRLINGELRVIKGVGHEVNTEAPKKLAKELRDFLGE